MTLKAVLFDFDDTIGDREKYARAAYEEALEKISDISGLEKEAVLQACMVYDQQGNTDKNYVSDRIEREFGICLKDCTESHDFNEWWEANLWRFTVVFENAEKTLKAIREKGYLTGIVTNGSAYGQNLKLERSGLKDMFDAVVVSGDFGVHKPDPAIFREAAKRLNVSCEECMFVGDTFPKDILGAGRAGMKPVWIWTHGPRVMKADLPVISDISQITELL